MANKRRPTIATEEVLDKYFSKRESILCESNEQSTVKVSDSTYIDSLVHAKWKFTSHHNKILNENQLKTLTKAIKSALYKDHPSIQRQTVENEKLLDDDNLNINKSKLHLPPMLFGNDILQLRVGDAELSVNAGDALLCWVAQVAFVSETIHILISKHD